MSLINTAELMGVKTEALQTPGFRLRRDYNMTDENVLSKIEANSREFLQAVKDGRISVEQATRIMATDRAESLGDLRNDNLTGLLTRKVFYPEKPKDPQELENAEYTRAFRPAERAKMMLDDPEKKGGDPKDLDFSVLFLDGDRFGDVNNKFGHDVGDALLKVMARAIKYATARPGDLAARWGGEEFIVVLPKTNAEHALLVAQRIHETYAQLQFKAILENPTQEQRAEEDPRLRLTDEEIAALRVINGLQTLSIGVHCYDQKKDTKDTMRQAADQAMYKAKATRVAYRSEHPDAEPYGFTVLDSGSPGEPLYAIANPLPGMDYTPPTTPYVKK